jgi:hypothetical protein
MRATIVVAAWLLGIIGLFAGWLWWVDQWGALSWKGPGRGHLAIDAIIICLLAAAWLTWLARQTTGLPSVVGSAIVAAVPALFGIWLFIGDLHDRIYHRDFSNTAPILIAWLWSAVLFVPIAVWILGPLRSYRRTRTGSIQAA